jgi:hypothetical protein
MLKSTAIDSPKFTVCLSVYVAQSAQIYSYPNVLDQHGATNVRACAPRSNCSSVNYCAY